MDSEKENTEKKSLVRTIFGWIWPIVLAVAAVLLLEKFVVTPIHVSGPSMNPNLYDTEQMFCFKQLPIHRGSVICFNAYGLDPQDTTPGKIYVKRVIGLPGDTVESKDGNLYVNQKLVNQSYISASQRNSTNTGDWTLSSISKKNNWPKNQGKTVVPQGSYFVLGDNRKVSNDSRYFGFIPKSHIIGVVKVFHLDQRAKNINQYWKSYYEVQQ